MLCQDRTKYPGSPEGGPPFFPAVSWGCSTRWRLRRKAVRELEREAAREQMLLPYKLEEDYAWPAVPYKCPVFIPHHDSLCLSYGPAAGQFCPRLPYIYSNQALAGGLFVCASPSQSGSPACRVSLQRGRELSQQAFCLTDRIQSLTWV